MTIVATSQLIKFMEIRFGEKPRRYWNDRLSREQTGFVPGMAEVNIVRLFNVLKKKEPKTYCIIIDFQSAYIFIRYICGRTY